MASRQFPPFGANLPRVGGYGFGAVDNALGAPGAPAPPATLAMDGVPISQGPTNGAPNMNMPGNFGAVSVMQTGRNEMGFTANASIPYHYLGLELSGERNTYSMAHARIGMFMFALSVEQLKNKPSLQSFSLFLDRSSCVMLDFISLNDWLAKNSARYENAAQVAYEWKLAGVLKVEVAPDAGARKKRPTRMVNLIAGGRVSAINCWSGRHILEGTPLFFIVKKACSKWEKNKTPSPELAKQGEWRIIPFARCDKQQPTLDDLAYWDVGSDGETVKRYGEKIFAGTASSSNVSYGNVAPEHTRSREQQLLAHGSNSSIELYVGV